MEPPCTRCKGSRHRWDKTRGAWVKCDCLKLRRTLAAFKQSGGPLRHLQETWRSFLARFRVHPEPKGLVAVAAGLARGELPPKWLVVECRLEVARPILSALLLKAACEGELRARILDLPSLIDAEFQPGRGAPLYNLDALVVELGGEPANKWNTIVMEKLVRQRWARGQFNVFVSPQEPTRLGGIYKSAAVDEAVRSYATRVRVEAKG